MIVPAQREQEIIARRQRVASLQLAGIRNQRRIAAQLGVGLATINRDIKALNAEWRERALADVAHEKAVDLDRLEHMIAAVWPAALLGHLGAVDRVMRLLERKAKLLGLDAPQHSTLDQQVMTTMVQIIAPSDAD